MIVSVFKAGKHFYLQVLLGECKYTIQEKKIPKYIINCREISSDSDEENSEEENSNEKRRKF